MGGAVSAEHATHRTDSARRRRAAGYTLLEMMVVLGVMALVVALVVPAALRTLAARRAQAVIGRVAEHIQELPVQAQETRLPVHWRSGDEARVMALLELPRGWQLTIAQPLSIESSGFCRGGLVHLAGEGRVAELKIDAPFCRVRRIGSS